MGQSQNFQPSSCFYRGGKKKSQTDETGFFSLDFIVQKSDPNILVEKLQTLFSEQNSRKKF